MSLFAKKSLELMLAQADEGEKGLKRTLGAGNLIALGIGAIIGAGLFVDNEVGAATATGHGEEVMRIVGSHTVVELMRQGLSPEEACRKAVERIITIAKRKNKPLDELQIGFIAINKKGEHGAYCLQKGFNYAVYSPEINNQLIDAKHIL
mgnify:CR=1 FL=1